MQSVPEIRASFRDQSGEHMQIREITQQLNENALGSFASGFAQGAGIAGSDTGGSDAASNALTGYGDARQKAAAQQARPMIELAAKKEMQGWNTAIADMLKQENVQSATLLSSTARLSLKRDLWNRLHKVFMQGKLGTNYVQSLPTSVDKLRQPKAKELVGQLNAATQAIMNFNQPAKDAAQQLAQWQTLSQVAYDAMSLVQFYPSQRVGGTKQMPKISGPNPDGSYRIGNTKVNPLDPVGKQITQKLQAAQTENSNQVPPIVSAPDGFRVGKSKDPLNPRDPVEAKMIEMIQAAMAAEAGAAV
jgi:hypothetical protein